MQDRFKFRIYCKSENKMMLFNNPTLIDGDILQGGLLFKNYDHKIKNVHEVKPEDLILMQCTGLKDKSGELIFEGDIISRGEDRGVIKYDDETASYYIRWKESETFIEDCEVIGNIYMDSHLLDISNNL